MASKRAQLPRLPFFATLATAAGLFSICSSVHAQNVTVETVSGDSQVEHALSMKGKVYERSYGEETVMADGHLGILSFETLIASQPFASAGETVYGIRLYKFRIRESDPSFYGYLDYDEARTLSDLLPRLITLAAKMKGHSVPYSEVDYATRGNLKFGFYQKGTEQFGYVSFWDRKAAFEVKRLTEIESDIDSCVGQLEAAGARQP